MRVKQINEEVLFPDEEVVKVSREDIEFLKERAKHNQRKRIRLCAHKNIEDRLHEMLIVHTKDTYVRPHKHLNKSESHHVIEGTADVVIFDDIGNIVEIICIGDYSSGRKFYYRISEPCYHTLLITSEILVFHETTNGPFKRGETIFAPWSPEDDSDGKEFMRQLVQDVENFVSQHKKYPVHKI